MYTMDDFKDISLRIEFRTKQVRESSWPRLFLKKTKQKKNLFLSEKKSSELAECTNTDDVGCVTRSA